MPNINLPPAFEQKNVPVVVASNNLYAPYTGVFIQSLLDHASERNNYDVIILERDISKENKRLLKSLAVGHANVSIRFYDPSPLFASFNYADEEHNWPLEIFYKIMAPQILNYPGRIITVDVDTLLKTDIARLIDEDLEGCCVGGVSGAPGMYARCFFNRTIWFSNRNMKDQDYWRKFGVEDWENIESYKDYVNGGLLLFDCNKYVQEVDVETILNTAQQRDGVGMECVLHALLKGKIQLLNPAWNAVQPVNIHTVENSDLVPKMYARIYHDNDAFQRTYDNPYLLHWAAKPKPWVCPDVPYGNEWWQTALRTPFVGHIIARMLDGQEKRRQYYRDRYGKADVDIWDPSPKGIYRTEKWAK